MTNTFIVHLSFLEGRVVSKTSETPLGQSVSTNFVANCRLKNFNLNLILTCNIYNLLFSMKVAGTNP